ncbi:MAG: aspartate aminotransferase family protein [Acidobacteria bacterium]|nr:MAG: aspartate aminotransferase family protein [Acidobacteriota bacterium]
MPDTYYFEDRDAALAAFGARLSEPKLRFFRSFGMDIVMGKREGSYFWDVNGRRFLNAHCNGGVFNLGHRNPEVIQALTEALGRFDVGNHHLLSEARAAVAQALTAGMPGDIEKVVFASGGGEAVDTALKMARGLTGRSGVVSATGGYHGHTGLSMATGDAKYREPFGPQIPGFVQVPFNDLDALDAEVTSQTAAVILEAVPATLGMVVPDTAYMASVAELCAERGALFVLDEIQTGLGRTGTLWAAEQYGVVPDFITTGKGLSGGIYPIAATCYRTGHDRIFEPDPFIHISTFGGAELGCAAALKVLEISSQPDFLERVRAVGESLSKGLEVLINPADGPLIEVRRLGMMLGLVHRTDAEGVLMSKILFDSGIFAVYSNNDKRVTQFLLPLTVTDSEVESAIEIYAGALERLATPQYQTLAKALAPESVA